MSRRLINTGLARGAGIILALCAWLSAHAAVGRITATEGAQLKSGAGPFSIVSVGRLVENGDTVRTKRKCFAEITFNDTSVIRVNERTDMVIQDAAALRRIRLDQGALWVRDSRGSNTRVQTPVGTATARGTVFTVTSEGLVQVFEGFVDLEAAGQTITLGPGEVGGIGPDSVPVKLYTIDLNSVPTDISGDPTGWWTIGNRGSAGGRQGAMDLGGVSALSIPLASVGLAGNLGTTTPVPEPAGLVALGFGVVALLRKRTSRQAPTQPDRDA